MYVNLKPHIGHKIACVCHGDFDNPIDICLECEDCDEILISSKTLEREEQNLTSLFLSL